jgi:hypothetical protein
MHGRLGISKDMAGGGFLPLINWNVVLRGAR